MIAKDISTAKTPDLRYSQRAMQRAADLARQTAIQTDTALVIIRDGQRVVIPAAELKREKP
jgi:hypothetical protein